MNTRLFSEAMNEVSDKYYAEAINYKKKTTRRIWAKAGAVAACLIAAIAVGSIFAPFPFRAGMVVSAYVSDTDERITAAGAVMSSGTISDSGEMKGHPLMFYLSGKDIASVRFSCMNQQISFTDWTEKRDKYGNAQNFTVAYGEDESEYYYLTIDWVPNAIIRELTDNADSAIANLPEEARHDIIVMEIAFENGETATKAITISLLDDGTFFAAFDDYKISDADTFVRRPDSEGIPRDRLFPADGGETVAVSGTDDAAPTQNHAVGGSAEEALETAKAVAEAYYADTVFEVVSMAPKTQSEDEISFSVCVSKGGIVQEPERTIWLQLENATWEVVNEGY